MMVVVSILNKPDKGSMGILNILSRVNTLGGVFQTESAYPKGTISVIRIPLTNPETNKHGT